MPLCVFCSQPMTCTCGHVAAAFGGTVAPCPLKEGAIWVHVISDEAKDVADIEVEVQGQHAATTTASGLSVFDPLPAASYTVVLRALTGAPRLLYAASPAAQSQQDVVVSRGEITYVAFTLTRLAKLKVLVKEDPDGPKLFDKAKVTATRAGSPDSRDTGADGVAEFGLMTPGEYTIGVELSPADRTKYNFQYRLERTMTLKPGDDLTVPLLVPKPLYVLELRLGDIDALFTPLTGGSPWLDPGVRERLQVLGYLYTPLHHPRIAVAGSGPTPQQGHAHACWEYYKRIHQINDDGIAVTRLKEELAGNLLAATLPASGVVLGASALPARGGFAAIRLPGGYGTTTSPVTGLSAGDHWFNNSTSTTTPAYDFRIGHRRDSIEDRVWAENPLLGKLPLIAKVWAHWPDHSQTAADGVPVVFGLLPPDDFAATSFAAPEPPSTVMNYGLDGIWWQIDAFPTESDKNGGLDASEWKGLWTLLHKAWDLKQDDTLAKVEAMAWVQAWKRGVDVPHSAVQGWHPVAATYPRLLQPAQYITDNLDAVFRRFMPFFDAEPTPPAAPGAYVLKMAKLTSSEWTAFWSLATAAALQEKAAVVNGDTPDLRKDRAVRLAKRWVEDWAAAPAVAWANVSNWWTAQALLPYPRVRPSTTEDKFDRRIDFLLGQRGLAAGRHAELAGSGQKPYIDGLYARWQASAAADDPQRKNAHQTRGGKLADPAGVAAVLERPSVRRAGFHDGRPTQPLDVGALELATAPTNAGRYPHASQCLTNNKGFAGVIFQPSRCGGDSYKLMACIDADWLAAASDGPAHRPLAETGTMVVWRNLRLHRYLQMANPAAVSGYAPSPWLGDVLANGINRPGDAEYARMRLDSPMIDLALLSDDSEAEAYPAGDPGPLLATTDKADRMKYRPLAIRPTSFKRQLSWGYCEWIIDCGGKELLTAPERSAAIVFGRKALVRWWTAQGYQPVDWDNLFGLRETDSHADPTSPFLFNMRTFTHYNQLIAGNAMGFAALDPVGDGDKARLTKGLQVLVEAMMEHLAGGGVLPGFTIVQIPRGDNTEFRAGNVTGSATITSGYGTAARGLYVSHTKAVYHGDFRMYSNTANTLHELGHVLGFAHQPPAGADLTNGHQRPILQPFTVASGSECVCVMSYSGCYGDFCGECLLSLRGLKQLHSDADIQALYA